MICKIYCSVKKDNIWQEAIKLNNKINDINNDFTSTHPTIMSLKKGKRNKQEKDILIQNGIIVKIGDNLTGTNNIIEEKELFVSDGWVDLFSVLREPGNEHQDSIENLLASAAKGGFTNILGISGTNPPLDNKAQIQFVKKNLHLHKILIILQMDL